MILYIIAILLIISGCSFRSEEMIVFDKMIGEVNKATALEENLYIKSIGFLGPELFKGISLGYNSKEWVNLEESRRIFVKAVDTIVRVVNQDEEFIKIRSAPITSANLLLDIEFAHDDSDKYIGMIILANDKLFYMLRDPKTYKSKDIHEETLQEAREILGREKNG